MLETVRSRQIYGFLVLTVLPGSSNLSPRSPLLLIKANLPLVLNSLCRRRLLPPNKGRRPYRRVRRCRCRVVCAGRWRSRRGEGGEGEDCGAQEEGERAGDGGEGAQDEVGQGEGEGTEGLRASGEVEVEGK
jgi:hypothetical protein